MCKVEHAAASCHDHTPPTLFVHLAQTPSKSDSPGAPMAASSTVIKTTLKVTRKANGLGAVGAVTSCEGPQGARRVNFDVPLMPQDGDLDTELSLDMHGPEVSWQRGEHHHVSFCVGEAKNSTHTHPTLQLHFHMERTFDAPPPAPPAGGGSGSGGHASAS